MKSFHPLLKIFILSCVLRSIDTQNYQAFAYLTNFGLTFIPAHPIEYLGLISDVQDMKKCFQYCNLNILCRTFVYDSSETVCTLYEGLIETGFILPSNSVTMSVGGILYTAQLFTDYNATCNKCDFNRYLQCSNVSLCSCPVHSFFNGSICRNQVYYAHTCSTTNSCRDELGLQCIVGVCQCSFGTAWNETKCVTMPSIITVAGTGTGGTALAGPVDLFLTPNGTLYEAEWSGDRVQVFAPNNSIAVLSQLGLGSLRGICVDHNSINSYVVSHSGNVTMWPSNMTILNLDGAFGIAIDSHSNLYVSSEFGGTVVCWNATSNTTTTVLTGLSSPRHIYLDEANSVIYVAERGNHRVVKASLSRPGNIIVVGGGNGNGSAADQLFWPNGVYVSQKTGSVYVADTGNSRIQKWVVNATFGLTVGGYPNGTPAHDLYGLSNPYAVMLDESETTIYVADFGNSRIQRIPLL